MGARGVWVTALCKFISDSVEANRGRRGEPLSSPHGTQGQWLRVCATDQTDERESEANKAVGRRRHSTMKCERDGNTWPETDNRPVLLALCVRRSQCWVSDSPLASLQVCPVSQSSTVSPLSVPLLSLCLPCSGDLHVCLCGSMNVL